MATDWDLSLCCGTEEIVFLCFFFGYFILNYLTWNMALVKPMKLLAVFCHEMSHATACWMTCGTVKGIEVYTNEGGVTKYVGGWRWLVIPAGYLGGSFWGAFYVAMSGNQVAAAVAAGIAVVALSVSLCYAPNKTMVGVSLGFIALTAVIAFVDFFWFSPILPFLTLYYGVFIGSFSVYDIYDDLISRTVEGSDSHACHQLIPCCLPRCVGVQFAVVALAFQAIGFYLALVWMTSN